jgi:hypothetical protein
LEAIKASFEQTLLQVSNKSSLAGAIRYTTSRWPSMTRFVEDGRRAVTASRHIAKMQYCCI